MTKVEIMFTSGNEIHLQIKKCFCVSCFGSEMGNAQQQTMHLSRYTHLQMSFSFACFYF